MGNLDIRENGVARSGRDMISAAHVLLNSERIANERELTVSSCLEFLNDGPASAEAVRRGVNDIWSGAELSRERVNDALDFGRRAGLFAVQEENGSAAWALTKQGYVEIQATQIWYANAFSRFSSQIQERAAKDSGRISQDQAEIWANTLVKVLTEGISQQEAHSGAVSKVASGTLRPATLDSTRMQNAITSMESSDSTKDFLIACLLDAIDDSNPFGNEIVNHVATSCVLHSIVAGRSRAEAQSILGSLKGCRVVLDTTNLVSYLGPADTSAHLAAIVRMATEAEMEVIAPEHVLEELNDVVQRVEDHYIPGLREALQSGRGARVYANTVNEQVLELFIEAAEAKYYRSWEEFARRARSLRSELTGLGIVVREHGNHERSRVNRLEESLTEVISNSSSKRGAKQIARDAESMEMVWRSRRISEHRGLNLWPGGWVITSDKKLTPAYRATNHSDPEPLTLSLGQWATLMTEAAPPPNVRDLIKAAATFLRQEAVLRIAVKYPPEIALTLARTLQNPAVSDTDVRVAQLSLQALLDDENPHVGYSSEAISTFVSSKRLERQSAVATAQQKEVELERRRMEDRALQGSVDISLANQAREKAEEETQTARNELLSLHATNAALLSSNEEYKALGKRRVTRAVVVAVSLTVCVGFAVLGLWGFALGTLIGVCIFWERASDWVEDVKIRSRRLFLALIPEVLGMWDLFTRV